MKLDNAAPKPGIVVDDSIPAEYRALVEFGVRMVGNLSYLESQRLVLSWSVFRHDPDGTIGLVLVNGTLPQALAVINEQRRYHVSDNFELRLDARQVAV